MKCSIEISIDKGRFIVEYGGFLPFELQKGDEYFNEYTQNTIKLNSGRSAFKYALIEMNPKKIYIPYYICETMVNVVKELGIDFEYYRINIDLMPIEVNLLSGEYILWVNYFGIMEEEKILYIHNKYKNVIYDNTQAFFIKPIQDSYNIYSCRKFFGVCDGAYLIKKDIRRKELKKDYSANRSTFILRSIEEGSNSVYNINLQNEKSIGNEMLKMSYLTERIMKSINYTNVKNIRRDNFYYWHDKLESMNEFTIPLNVESPLYYPFLIKKEGVKEELIKRKVYVPTLWKNILEIFDEEEFEFDLAKYLVCLPIDQRYTNEDINNMSNILMEIISLDNKIKI